MYHPFAQFHPTMLPTFANMQVKYLVAQFYQRGVVNGCDKIPLLLTDYVDLEKAEEHCTSIKPDDKWAAIINLEHKKHLVKLGEMSLAESPYLLYVAFEDEKKAGNLNKNRRLVAAARYYIDTHAPARPGGSDKVNGIIDLYHGQLYVHFKWGEHKLTTLLSSLEEARIPQPPSVPEAVADTYRLSFQLNRS
jgi:hypothetical protein